MHVRVARRLWWDFHWKAGRIAKLFKICASLVSTWLAVYRVVYRADGGVSRNSLTGVVTAQRRPRRLTRRRPVIIYPDHPRALPAPPQ